MQNKITNCHNTSECDQDVVSSVFIFLRSRDTMALMRSSDFGLGIHTGFQTLEFRLHVTGLVNCICLKNRIHRTYKTCIYTKTKTYHISRFFPKGPVGFLD